MDARFELTREHFSTYFDRICLPHTLRVFDVTSLTEEKKLAYLNLLIKHQLVTVPWENLSQHYAWHRTVNVEAAFLFRKITQNPGRGGYCFEVNYLVHIVLFSLKFDVYMAGSRVNLGHGRGYTGFEHIVNIVTVGSDRYVVDCGFGTQGPICALLLQPGLLYPHVAPAQSRMRHDCIPVNLTSQKIWILEYRKSEDEEFQPIYCFTDLEFTPTDIVGLNMRPGTDPHSMFTHTVLAVRYTTTGEASDTPRVRTDDISDERIDGTISLVKDTLKWRREGQIELELHLATEADRVEALRKYFGISLTDEEQSAIVGTAAMIVSRVT